MKTLITTVALTALIASSAFAAPATQSNVVTVAGKVIGQDPDINVRSMLLWDAYVNEQ